MRTHDEPRQQPWRTHFVVAELHTPRAAVGELVQLAGLVGVEQRGYEIKFFGAFDLKTQLEFFKQRQQEAIEAAKTRWADYRRRKSSG